MISCKEQHIQLTYVEKTCINDRYTHFFRILSIKFTFRDKFCRYNTFFNFSKISNCWTKFEGFSKWNSTNRCYHLKKSWPLHVCDFVYSTCYSLVRKEVTKSIAVLYMLMITLVRAKWRGVWEVLPCFYLVCLFVRVFAC